MVAGLLRLMLLLPVLCQKRELWVGAAIVRGAGDRANHELARVDTLAAWGSVLGGGKKNNCSTARCARCAALLPWLHSCWLDFL